jgi:hypothetical protein
MDTSRVVEVLHDRGVGISPRWLLGSGFILRSNVVITAAHNLGDYPHKSPPEATIVRLMDGSEKPVTNILADNLQVDLAVLGVSGISDMKPVALARVDRKKISVLSDVMAVGFPNYKYQKERPLATQRQPAQPVGIVPTAENATSGRLVLKISAGEPATPNPGDGSPWAGLSGAAVFCGEALLGVVNEHHSAEGLGVLHFIPFTEVFELPVDQQILLGAAIGIADMAALPIINGSEQVEHIDTDLERMLLEIRAYEKSGLLTPSAAKSLTVTAFKHAKGW